MANLMPGEHDWMYGIGGANPTMGMGFPSPPPATQQGGGLLGKLGGLFGGGNFGGLLGEEEKKTAQRQALMAMASQLMAASGPSDRRVSFGQALGPALMAGQQAYGQAGQDALQAMLLKAKMQPKKERSRPTMVMGPNGQPMYVSEEDAIGKQPYMKPGSEYGAYQPGDYTPESWAKFLKSKDPAVLERYITPRQEFSPSFQNVTRTLPDGSTQQGTFNTRSGEYNWAGEVVPAGTKARTDAAGRAEGTIEGTRSAKAVTAYPVFQTGMKALEEAMSATNTGPLACRLPALTAGQQIAEGAEATMAPVLKQLFRDAGEGTFTDADQAMLMKMVPTRTDHPEARRAKIQMIDEIVRAKLGITGGGASGSERPPLSSFQK
jgi:hypothetical protein